MFDFRYHALSLVAVFLALAVGLLLGVAIGDEGLVSSAEQDIRASLREDVREARAESARLRADLADERELQEQLYPLMAVDRLVGMRVGLISMGEVPDSVVDSVRESLGPTGGRLVTVDVIRVPLDMEALTRDLAGTRYAGMARDPDLVETFGRRIGIDFVRGGRILRDVRDPLLQTSSGSLDDLTGIVLYRQTNQRGAEAPLTARFEDGLVDGLRRTDVPLVGVEETSTTPSTIPWYQDRDVSSVDNVDRLTGRASTVFVLAGASGSYGIKRTASRVVPEVTSSADGP